MNTATAWITTWDRESVWYGYLQKYEKVKWGFIHWSVFLQDQEKALWLV